MPHQSWKTICSLAAILATGLLSAAPKKAPPPPLNRGDVATSQQMSSGYNQSAMYDVKGEMDWFLQASFLYWYVGEETLDIVSTTQRSGLNNSRTPDPGHIDFQTSKYNPGFKAAVGFDSQFDNWSFFAEYTWMRQTTNMHKTAEAGQALFIGSWVGNANNSSASQIASQWKLELDIGDVAVSRPYYQGTRLTINPLIGLRGMWLRQANTLDFTPNSSSGNTAPSSGAAQYENKSWAIGPRLGVYSNWLLGAGFRTIGNAFTSILYTRYYKLTMDVDQLDSVSGSNPLASPTNFSAQPINTLRAQGEMNLGLGWGKYINKKNYHIDFSATYDFMIFWNQNMSRSLSIRSSGSLFVNPSNLYIHGLTVTGRFDF